MCPSDPTLARPLPAAALKRRIGFALTEAIVAGALISALGALILLMSRGIAG
jgi:hypothetical protein